MLVVVLVASSTLNKLMKQISHDDDDHKNDDNDNCTDDNDYVVNVIAKLATMGNC